MNVALYISAINTGLDLFKEWKNLKMYDAKQSDNDIAILHNKEDEITFDFGNLSSMMNPSQWRNFDIKKALTDITSVREQPENGQELTDLLKNSSFSHQLISLKVMGEALTQLEKDPETHLDDLKHMSVIAPVEALKSYSNIIKKSATALQEALSDALPLDDNSQFKDVEELKKTPHPTIFLEKAHEQNAELLDEYLKNRSSDDLKILISKTNANELSAHPAKLGVLLGTRAALEDSETRMKAEGGIALHISNTLSPLKVDTKTKTNLLDSSLDVAKGLALNSATATYSTASKPMQSIINTALDKFTDKNVKGISADFQKSVNDLAKQVSPDDLKGVLSNIAKTFQATKGADIDYRSEMLQELLENTIFTLKNPHSQLKNIAPNGPTLGPSPKR
jgi:hypothetical protein